MHLIDIELNELMLRERLNEAEKQRKNREILRHLRRERSTEPDNNQYNDRD